MERLSTVFTTLCLLSTIVHSKDNNSTLSAQLTGKMHASSTSSIPQGALNFPFARVSTFLAYFTRDLEEIHLVFCTGAMIMSNLVLTAANCLFQLNQLHFSGVRVVLASTHLSHQPSYSQIQNAYYYPGYSNHDPSHSMDVAVALLVKHIVYPNLVAIVPDKYPNPAEVGVEGWKFKNPSLDLSMEKKMDFKENTLEYSQNHQEYAQEISQKKFRLPTTVDACQLPWQKLIIELTENGAIDIGDNGAPAQINARLVAGVISQLRNVFTIVTKAVIKDLLPCALYKSFETQQS